MRKTILFASFIMLLVLLALLAIAARSKTPPAKGDAEFKAMIDRYYEAWSALDANKPAPMYAKEADLVFYDIAPMKYNGWAEYKAGVQKNLFDTATSAKLTPNADLKVTRKGDIAWTTVTFHISVRPKTGSPLELDGRHTAIWEKRGDKWLIVHEHVSAPLPG